MLRPSGSALQHDDVGAGGPQDTRGPTSNAAPFAQSSTTRRPASVRPSSAASTCATYSVAAIVVRPRRRPAATGADASDRRELVLDRAPRRRPAACGRRARAASRRCRTTGCGSPRSPRPRHRRPARGTRRPASAARRPRSTPRPFRREPAAQRGLDAGARLAGVAPDDERVAAEHPRRGATERGDEVVGEISVGVAADAVGAEPQHGRARVSASSTAAPCGPS